MSSTTRDGRAKPKPTSTLSWVSDKLAAGAARVNGGEFQDVEIAVVKATNHDVCQPKEKHVRTLREIIASSGNRKKVIYIVHALYERLVAPNETWLVVLKTLMTFHKLLKADGDASFKQEIARYKEKRKLSELLRLNNFADRSQKESWDYSAFVRVYSSYLEERLTVYDAIKYDVDKDGGGATVRFKTASPPELLAELPMVQKLIQRLMACVPEGAAMEQDVILEVMRWLLTECFRIYRVIMEGVISLADQFFEMDRVDAAKGLDMYRESVVSFNLMQTFFNAIQNLSIGRQMQFPHLASPPEDFIKQMEEHVKGATGRTAKKKFPSTVSRNVDGTPSAALASKDRSDSVNNTITINKPPAVKPTDDDLLGLDALEISSDKPPVPAPVHQPVDPFGEVVKPAPLQTTGFLDDWGQSQSVTSPVAESSNTDQQNTSPFDDFFGGGPMVQPPAAPDSTFSQPYQQQPAAFPPVGGFQSGVQSSNPFGDSNPPAPVRPVAHGYSPSGGVFTGPGAFVDPFAGLTPNLQKKQNYVPPGAPMRVESLGSNPFGSGEQSDRQKQQDFMSFF